jgi:hypothetical protein
VNGTNGERHAYHRWVPALGERAPRLLAEIDDPPAIIMTALSGTPVAELDLPPEIERDVFGQGGALRLAQCRTGTGHAEHAPAFAFPDTGSRIRYVIRPVARSSAPNRCRTPRVRV